MLPFFLFQGYNFYRSVCSMSKAKTWSDFHDVIDPAEVIWFTIIKLVISGTHRISAYILNLNLDKKCCCNLQTSFLNKTLWNHFEKWNSYLFVGTKF